MPPIAWVSIAILWFGIGEASKVFIIVIGTFVPCLLNSYNGVRLIEPQLYDVIRMLGGKRRDEILHVCFPAAFPAIFAGLQLSLSSAWTCVLAAELVSARSGMGFITLLGDDIIPPGHDRGRNGYHRIGRVANHTAHQLARRSTYVLGSESFNGHDRIFSGELTTLSN